MLFGCSKAVSKILKGFLIALRGFVLPKPPLSPLQLFCGGGSGGGVIITTMNLPIYFYLLLLSLVNSSGSGGSSGIRFDSK